MLTHDLMTKLSHKKYYISNKAFFTLDQVWIINKIDFIITAFDINSNTFIMHMSIKEQEIILVHSKKPVEI